MNLPLSYIEVSRDALRANCQRFRSLLGPRQQLIAVVKANAYGHGLAEVVAAVEDLVDGFQVDDIEELRELRRHTTKRTLVLGYVQNTDLAEAVSLDGELAIYDLARLRALGALGAPTRVHLKIDALLGRQGLLPEELPGFVAELKQFPSVSLAGVYGHYSNLEDTPLRSHAEAQQARFERGLGALMALGYGNTPTHFSSTAGILAYEGTGSTHGLVRMGIGLYGLYPSPGFQRLVELQPALRWISHLAQVKDLPAGFPVGYGLTYITEKPTRIGIVPQGYADGFDRSLSNCGCVLVGGRRCPVLGRIAMNMFAVDLEAVPEAKAEDEVILVGPGATAEEMADLCETINYEVVARLSSLLPRLVRESL